MWTQKALPRDRDFSPGRDYDGEIDGIVAMDQSEFSPVFWLASGSAGAGGPAVRRPIYPMLVGVFLILAFLMQRGLFLGL